MTTAVLDVPLAGQTAIDDMLRPRLVSLCTGYSGMEMGLRLAGLDFELAAVADPDPAVSAVLAHHHPGVPNLGSITAVEWTMHGPVPAIDWAGLGAVDILTAGYPCQPFSLAGNRKGTGDDRHIWPAVAYAVRALRPRLVLLENVAGHLSLGFGRVLADLASIGYVGSWRCVRASDVGAAHRRERVFIAAWPADAPRPQLEARWEGRPGGGVAADTEGDPRRFLDGDRGPVRDLAGSGGLTAPVLFPTPRASDMFGAGKHGDGGMDLRTAVSLLPTPVVTDSNGARNATSGRREGSEHHGGTTLSDVAFADLWHEYAPAIARQERAFGRVAPEPTEPGRNRPRLNARFSEWLMGLPDGHVTGVVGLSRNEQLRMLGNGIVPQQAAAAIREQVMV